MTPEEIRRDVEEAGLGEFWPGLEALLLPTVLLRPSPAEDELIPAGASKLGGAPDLPPGTPWPIGPDGQPCMFLAQVNLAESAPFDAEGALPRYGLLSFFAASGGQAGIAESQPGGDPVLYFDADPAGFARASSPDGLEDWDRLAPQRFAFEASWTLPGVWSHRLPFYEPGKPYNDPVWVERNSCYGDLSLFEPKEQGAWSEFQLLGYPDTFQGDEEQRLEMAARGILPPYPGPPDYQELFTRGFELVHDDALRDWRLLFQVPEDSHSGLVIGDAGLLFYFIRRVDLAARNFGQARCVMQCA